jgi:spore coat polysaccharide biosynthesis protein SpsF
LPTGRTVLEEVLVRCQRIPGIDVVCCAIPARESGEEAQKRRPALLAAIERSGVVKSEGPEIDLLARYTKAARELNASVIMRITADCPMLDVVVCHTVLVTHLRHGSFTTNSYEPRVFPAGLDCEVFSREMLEEANAKAISPEDLEHCTPYMRRNFPMCKVALGEGHPENYGELRWVLDTQEDYEHICALMAAGSVG